MQKLIEKLGWPHYVLALINLALMLGFGSLFLGRLNYEFVIYVAVIAVLLTVVTATFTRIDYSLPTLIGLTIWSGMHLAGGGLQIGDGRLYDVILFPMSQSLPIFRYDQLVHMFGFGTCTLLSYDLLKKSLSDFVANPIALRIVLVMAGVGFGALNEVVEFLVTLIVPSSGVGGYENTALDLCSNLIGALLALPIVNWLHNTESQMGQR